MDLNQATSYSKGLTSGELFYSLIACRSARVSGRLKGLAEGQERAQKRFLVLDRSDYRADPRKRL